MAAGVIEAERLLADAAATEALGAEIASSLLKGEAGLSASALIEVLPALLP